MVQKFSKKLSKEHVISNMIPLFNILAGDEQDSVRLLVVEALISISELFTNEEISKYLMNVLRGLSNDKSWRVRYMVADKYVQVISINYIYIQFTVFLFQN